MDAVGINPTTPQDEEMQKLMAEYEALKARMSAAGMKAPSIKIPQIPETFVPTTVDEAMDMVRDAWDDPNGSIVVFFPMLLADKGRLVLRAVELGPAPARSPKYFTIHRSAMSKPSKISPGGVNRNFGVAFKVATLEDSSRLSKASGKFVAPGSLIASGYNVEAGDPGEAPVEGFDL